MKLFLHEKPRPSTNPAVEKKYDVIVVGGGMSGVSAAIASARQGARTAIIQDRSVFGGNASSEIKMHICGASCHWGKKNAAETGILMELLLDNKFLNQSFNYSIWDGVLWSKILHTENLDCYLNTTMNFVESDGHEIKAVECYQMTTETRYRFVGNIYIDATGLGSLSYFAGAEYRIGRDGMYEFNEKSAPDTCSGETMGNTILFCAYDTGRAVKFTRPGWAYIFGEEDFNHRYHGDVTVYHTVDDVVVLKPGEDYDTRTGVLVEKYDVQSGYWWIELGGDWNDIIKDAEDIRWELYKTVYGIWDHIKNRGDHGAENYELLWIGSLPGVRESRRIIGDYVLTEQDILSNQYFDDAVAYGGWPMDEHTAGGFTAKNSIPSKVTSFPGLYSIPYRSYYAKDIANLLMCGRIISASKLAMSSARIMGTCSVGGQAVGTAAAIAIRNGCTVKEVGERHIRELQQELIKSDCYIPGVMNFDENDIAKGASVTASSERKGYEAVKVINGITRNTETQNNLWVSNGISKDGETLSLVFNESVNISEIRITFDPNLSEERCISVAKSFIDKEPIGVDNELVKDYAIRIIKDKTVLFEKEVAGNYQRLNVHKLEDSVYGNQVTICIKNTHGCFDARVFEVRIY